MLREPDLHARGIVGPDQNDREHFNDPTTGDFFLEKFTRIVSKPWVRVGIGGAATLTIPTAAFAQEVIQSQNPYDINAANQDSIRIKNFHPLSPSDQAAKSRLLEQIDSTSGILHDASDFQLKYVATAGELIANITSTDANLAKQDAEQWLTQQGFSQDGICNSLVFNLSGPEARGAAQNFNPTPDGCGSAQDLTQPDHAASGDSPDTNMAYQQSAEEARKENDANPDPKQYLVNLEGTLLTNPYQDGLIKVTFNPGTDKLLLEMPSTQRVEAMRDFHNYLTNNNVDPNGITNFEIKFTD